MSRAAPPAIDDDEAAFAAAMDDFAPALANVDYDLDAIFSTPEGEQLAEDAFHALTPRLEGASPPRSDLIDGAVRPLARQITTACAKPGASTRPRR